MLKKERELNAYPPALPLRRAILPRRQSPPLETLAAQFAPQGNQAERSETEQGKCRASFSKIVKNSDERIILDMRYSCI
jgi:hypothetical protein